MMMMMIINYITLKIIRLYIMLILHMYRSDALARQLPLMCSLFFCVCVIYDNLSCQRVVRY